MLGEHDETGCTLAAYAALTHELDDWAGREPELRAQLTQGQLAALRKRLQTHRNMAEYYAHTLLADGRSHEFGDYRALSHKRFSEIFQPTAAAVRGFIAQAAAARTGQAARGGPTLFGGLNIEPKPPGDPASDRADAMTELLRRFVSAPSERD